AATPSVTATEIRTAIIASAGRQLTSADVNTIVASALAALPAPQIDSEQITRLVENAVTATVPEGTSAEEIAALVSTAVDAANEGALTRGDMLAAIAAAIAEQSGDALTTEQLAAIVASSVQVAADAANAAAAAAESAAAIASQALAEIASIPVGLNLPPAVFALDGFNSSDQSGSATLTVSGVRTIVTLELSEGSLDTELVHIHAGQCGDTLGGIAHELTSFVGGFGGSVSTVNSSLTSLLTSGFAINAYKAGDPGVSTACGNIPASAASVTFDLDDLNDSDQTGTATLTPNGGSTIVTLVLTTGALESELANIQAGECGASGDIVHSLTSFVDGSGISATTLNASLASLRTGNLIVNVHDSGDPDTKTACGAIL
ncbi:MAG: CHRD domain-containing protein, partial [SAR202 cluster bacterium]|nr:CHRD domain-containing protein [SAR202 cluster bacterium]